jgi:hypothetical protein
MNPLPGWRPLALLTAALAVFLLASGCQQGKAPQQQKEGKSARDATAEIPQPMLDALHGKRPEDVPAPAMPPAPPSMAPEAQAAPGRMPVGMPRVPAKVTVPDEVKKAWKAVIVEVAEAGGATKDYKVTVPGEITIPGSGLRLKVESFLPDFKMTPGGITSLSNEPNNPAARVEVVEDGKTVFKGWLFKLYPEAHPFQHPKYRVVLKDWVAS